MTLQDMNITRCIKPKIFDEVIHCSLHYFSDAYETGYGMSAYIRLVNAEGVVHCSLLVGKSRVAPLKSLSIPRLELTTATLSVKVSRIPKVALHVALQEFKLVCYAFCYTKFYEKCDLQTCLLSCLLTTIFK